MYTLLLTKPRFIKISLVLLQWPSPLPGSHARYTAFSCRGSSWLRQFPRLSLFLMTLTVLSIAQLFCRISLTLVLSDVSLDLTGVTDWEGRPQRWNAILTTSHQGYMLSTRLAANGVDYLEEALGCQVSPLSSYFPLSCPVLFGSKPSSSPPPWRSVSTWIIWNFCYGRFVSSSPFIF